MELPSAECEIRDCLQMSNRGPSDDSETDGAHKRQSREVSENVDELPETAVADEIQSKKIRERSRPNRE